jgi:rubrerythrin
MYEAILARESQFCTQQAVIGAILKDEERHMDQVSQRLLQDAQNSEKDLERLLAFEETEFHELAQAWSCSLDRL